ncbi:hypothetical protein [Nocardioides sp.]|uniref:hypothetical protein n=1 Tax=Nocardioides sp. TaxID=35761 RepID=UPI002B26C476|nr:hypothetical protein [Nocardioides sp.]
MHTRNPFLGALGALALLSPLTTSVPAVSASSDDQTVTVRAARLERGPDIVGPHLKGHTVVDGDVRVKVRADHVFLLGPTDGGYVVEVIRDGRSRTLVVAPDEDERALVKGSAAQVRLSGDGETLAVIRRVTRRTVIRIRSVADRALLAEESFGRYPELLDLDGDRLLVTRYDGGAVAFDFRAGTRRRVTDQRVHAADLATNRLAYYTADPYEGGCTVVAPLDRPTNVQWTSCDERVHAFSPDGSRMATVDKLADGAGPGQVWERTVRGRLLGSYRVTGYFGQVWWETTRDLLLEAWGRRKGATVRCSEGDCERVTAVRSTPEL